MHRRTTVWRRQAIYLTYNILAMPILSVYLLTRLAQGKSREGWAERWGHLPEALAQKSRPRLWIHAASVGEVMAATPILRAYRERNPGTEIVMSVITPGGYEVASGMKDNLVDAIFYCPFDVPLAVNRAIDRVQADVFIGMETELWPNLLYQVKRHGARTLLVNARISDRSLPSYERLRSLFRWTLGQFDHILAQTERDAERFRYLGAAPERVQVFGNSKFDQTTDRLTKEQVRALRQDLRLPPDAPVLVVGSTRTAEEERKIYAAYHLTLQSVPDLVLIHAPRHVDRAEEVAGLMREAGLDPVRRTELAGRGTSAPVSHLILDTFGELAGVYALGDVAFIGNSLVRPGGGQNLLQPLAQGKPVVYGPYMNNFRDLCALAEQARVGFRVVDEQELAAQWISLLRSETDARSDLAERALSLLDSNRGVAARYAAAIEATMPVSV